MADVEDDLKAVSDDLADDAEQLAQIEREKQTLEATDRKRRVLSEEAERLGRRILPKAVAENELANEAQPDPRPN